MDCDFLLKIILVGDTAVGKTNITQRFLHNKFSQDFKATIGVDFGVKKIEIEDGEVVKVQIWDTAGQERYRSVVSSYYKNAHGAILVYDITSRSTFESLSKWTQELRTNLIMDTIILLIGNKKDLNEKREVSVEEGETFAQKNGMFFMETSALLADQGGVSEAVTLISKEIVNTIKSNAEEDIIRKTSLSKKPVTLKERNVKEADKDKKGCC